MSCICQQCGRNYRVDLIVPDDVWEKIKPDGKAKGAGLLCGACILNKIEALCNLTDEYGAIYVDGDSGAFNILNF